MSDTTQQLESLIERLTRGDEGARDQLIERAYTRLQRLVTGLLQRSFPDLRGRHEVDSILHDTYFRLRQALEQARPPTVLDFFRLAAHKVRQVLLDLTQQQRRLDQRELGIATLEGDSQGGLSLGDNTQDPAHLAQWTDFHHAITQLPDQERTVFELRFYTGLTNEEIARLLGLHPRKVSYLWVAATEGLADRGVVPGDFSSDSPP